MKTAPIKEIRGSVKQADREELVELVLRLARFKKENKELLSYLLFEASDEAGFVMAVKQEMDERFAAINRSSYFFIKKSLRKILRDVKKYSRYSGRKETEIELLIYYLVKTNGFSPSIYKNKTLENLYYRQLALVEKNMAKLHEDLQYDFRIELEALRE